MCSWYRSALYSGSKMCWIQLREPCESRLKSSPLSQMSPDTLWRQSQASKRSMMGVSTPCDPRGDDTLTLSSDIWHTSFTQRWHSCSASPLTSTHTHTVSLNSSQTNNKHTLYCLHNTWVHPPERIHSCILYRSTRCIQSTFAYAYSGGHTPSLTHKSAGRFRQTDSQRLLSVKRDSLSICPSLNHASDLQHE